MIRRSEEREFVRRMMAGDEAAFDLFADSYIPALYRFAANRLDGDHELIRDIVQTTICKAIGKLSTFRAEAALMTWLCACCRNEIAAHFRKKMRPIREVDLETVEETSAAELGAAAPAGPESAALRSETSRLVHVALDSLPPHYGQVLEWKYLENLPVKEIANRLGLGAKAAESLLTRARDAFRRSHARLTETTRPAAKISRYDPRRTETAL
jgi:RNA polymerase sigma-70 factor (ECF subfamily)